LITAGTYVLSPELVSQIPNDFFPITRWFEDCLGSGRRIGAWEIEEDWLDVGQREQLRQAQEGT
jgi:NDP-sugar pyrophosphorylase family protein